MKSSGVDSSIEIPVIQEIYLNNPPHVGLISHELMHVLLDAADLYHGWSPESQYVPFAPGPFSLMATYMPGNLEPFHRLKYGWLRTQRPCGMVAKETLVMIYCRMIQIHSIPN